MDATLERTQLTDRQRVRDAFAELKTLGYFAREAEADGWRAVPVDRIRNVEKVVFWHKKEIESFAENTLVRKLHLQHFARDTDEILEIVRGYGLSATVEEGRYGGVVILPNRGNSGQN